MHIVVAAGLSALSYVPRHAIAWLHRSSVVGKKSVHIAINSANRKQWVEGSPSFDVLYAMAEDPDLRSVIVQIQTLPVGWSNLQAFRDALHRIKRAGKSLFAYIQVGDAKALFLTSMCDYTYLSEGVELFWAGLGGRHNFYGALLSKYEIKADIEAAGEFKSFGESYTRAQASDANLVQLQELYGDIQEQYLQALATDYKIEIHVLQELMGQSPLEAKVLQQHAMITDSLYMDQLVEKVGAFTNSKAKPLSFAGYARLHRWKAWWNWGDIREKVAVLHLTGAISENDPEATGIVAEKVMDMMEMLGMDDSIKAVVLCVNSPGGSATASDRLARSIKQLKKKKPVVAYFSTVSASGGYYLSCLADSIVAAPASITGSIGVVGGKLVLGSALEKQGVHGQTIAVGPDTDMLDFWTEFTPSQRERFRGFLWRTYTRFIEIVSEGRTMPEEAVERAAKGRVWTGKQAVELGLVDQTGFLRDALELTANRLSVRARNIRPIHIRHKKSAWRQWSSRLFSAVSILSPLSMQNTMENMLHKMFFSQIPLLLQHVHKEPLSPLLLLPFDIDGAVDDNE